MDCIISGISLYTQNLLLVLAYCLPEEDDESTMEENTPRKPSGGIPRKLNNQPPELRLIDLTSQSEVDKDGLCISRFERLSAHDYHLGVLHAQTIAAAQSSRGALETLVGLGTDALSMALNPMSLFSSAASIRSKDSDSGSKIAPPSRQRRSFSVHPHLEKPGIKIFIHSPYDCVLATKRDLSDHLTWLLEHQKYQEAWELVDHHPEIVTPSPAESGTPTTPTPQQTTQSSDDFYDDTASIADLKGFHSPAEREKRRIGDLWVQELVKAENWVRAGQVCGQVVGTPDKWEKWVKTFADAGKLDDIVEHIPSERTQPPIPGSVYELCLGHYLQSSKPRFRGLLQRWSPDLFDVSAVTASLEDQLRFRDVREDSIEDGEVGRDWKIVVESLAKLHEASGRNRDALRCYVKLHDADNAMRLIRDRHLADAVTDDIPSFITLRVPPGRAGKMSRQELEQATSEAITLLVDNAQHGLVKPDVVISQLQARKMDLYTFFYLRGLWRGDGIHHHGEGTQARLVSESQSLVDQFADLAVHLFAMYDQGLLNSFLRTSTAYAFEKVGLPFLYSSHLVKTDLL